MAILPKKPQKGQNSIQALYYAICQIIDYLPSLEVRGDNKTIKVSNYFAGKTISAINSSSSNSSSVSGGSSTANAPILAKVVSTNTDSPRTLVRLYPNGPNGPSGPSVDAYAVEKAFGSVVPIDSWIIVFPSTIQVLGGND